MIAQVQTCPPQELPDLIQWTQEGTILIPDPDELEVRAARAPCLASSTPAQKKLPIYFRHGHYSSFLRQLNNARAPRPARPA